jgi:Mrp family chromosome partitioning ATPase
VPTNLQLLEKANRSAHLFERSKNSKAGESVALQRRAAAPTGALSKITHQPSRTPHITFRFQPQFLDLAYQLLSPRNPGENFSIGICPVRGEDSAGRFVAFFGASIGQMAKSPVLLIETNFRRPCLAKYLCAPGSPGLREMLSPGNLRLDCIHPTRYENLHLLPAGTWAAGKEPRHMKRGLERIYKLVAKQYPSVIVSFPAWDEIPCVRPCYALADAMLLAVRPGACGARTIRKTVGRLRQARVKLVGSVLSSLEP